MQDITAPLKEIIDKGFPKPKSIRLITPGNYQYVNEKSAHLLSGRDAGDHHSSSKKISVGFFFDGPFLPIRNGACYTLYNLMRSLSSSKKIRPVLLNCFREWDDPKDYFGQEFTSVFISPEDYYHDTGLVRKIIKDFDLSIAQFYNTEILINVSPWINDGTKITLDVQNVDHKLMQRLGADPQEVAAARSLQMRALELSDHTFCRSKIDADQLLELGADPSKISIYRGGIYTSDFAYQKRKQNNKKLVYLGHMYYQPNENAVTRIINEILPKLDSDYSLSVIGSCPPSIKNHFSDKRVEFKGGVDDISTELKRYSIAVAPIFEGSGTRLKILDYLASGIPVLTTDLSVEGLDPRIKKYITIENDIKKYAERIRHISNNPGAYQLKSKLGRKFVEEVYDWSNCVDAFIKVYGRL